MNPERAGWPPRDRPQPRPQKIIPFPSGPGKSKKESLPEVIELELRHFHHRLPPDLLRKQEFDPGVRLKFESSEILALVAAVKPTIPISKIAAQLPDLFVGSITAENDLEIFFPWKEIAALVCRCGLPHKSRTDGTELEGAEKAASPWANRKLGQGGPKIAPPPHLSEVRASETTARDEKRAALNARKKSWFHREHVSHRKTDSRPVEKGESKDSESSQEDLKREIHALREELAKAQRERDEAIKDLTKGAD